MVRGQWANLARVTPLLFFEGHPGIFNDHRESGPWFNVSSDWIQPCFWCDLLPCSYNFLFFLFCHSKTDFLKDTDAVWQKNKTKNKQNFPKLCEPMELTIEIMMVFHQKICYHDWQAFSFDHDL